MPKHYTEEEKQFIIANYPSYDPKDFTEMFNAKFGKTKSVSTLVNYANYIGLKLDKSSYSKMCRRANDNRRANIGDVSIYKNGRAYMKTEDGWKEASIAVWEKEHDKIPKGYRVMYLDGDTTNYSLDNLFLVTIKEMGVVASMRLQSGDPELTKTAILWCRLYHNLGMTNNDLRNFRRMFGGRTD